MITAYLDGEPDLINHEPQLRSPNRLRSERVVAPQPDLKLSWVLKSTVAASRKGYPKPPTLSDKDSGRNTNSW